MNRNKENSYKYRIDPINENGKFDFDFYSRSDYKNKREIIVSYLKEEGFLETPGTYIFYNETNNTVPYIWWVKVD